MKQIGSIDLWNNKARFAVQWPGRCSFRSQGSLVLWWEKAEIGLASLVLLTLGVADPYVRGTRRNVNRTPTIRSRKQRDE